MKSTSQIYSEAFDKGGPVAAFNAVATANPPVASPTGDPLRNILVMDDDERGLVVRLLQKHASSRSCPPGCIVAAELALRLGAKQV